MKYPIYSTIGEILFEAEIDCDETAPDNHKKRLAVLWAVRNEKSMAEVNVNLIGANLIGANLIGANLCDAHLDGADFQGADLRNANLIGANLIGANLIGANLCDAHLDGADFQGADLRNANLIGADFQGADLRNANLIGADFQSADLRNANLCGADFQSADLRNADLRNADLRNADFRDTILSGTNLEGTILSNCDVKIENIHQKVYEAASQPDALDMDMWHTCDTTHCRAGWVVHLAGEAGYELERLYGTAVAALMIYRTSDPDYHEFPDFYASHEEALADMKRLAEAEAA